MASRGSPITSSTVKSMYE